MVISCYVNAEAEILRFIFGKDDIVATITNELRWIVSCIFNSSQHVAQYLFDGNMASFKMRTDYDAEGIWIQTALCSALVS